MTGRRTLSTPPHQRYRHPTVWHFHSGVPHATAATTNVNTVWGSPVEGPRRHSSIVTLPAWAMRGSPPGGARKHTVGDRADLRLAWRTSLSLSEVEVVILRRHTERLGVRHDDPESSEVLKVLVSHSPSGGRTGCDTVGATLVDTSLTRTCVLRHRVDGTTATVWMPLLTTGVREPP